MRSLLVTLAAAVALTAAVQAASVKIDKTDYLPNDDVVIQFTAAAEWPETAWVGIVPSSVPHGSEATNDANDVAYEYVHGRTDDTITLTAPTAGSYDVRLNDSDSDGVEIATVPLRVGAPSAKVTLALDQKRFIPGETIRV